MELNEKALVKLMKNSRKAGGVKLLRTGRDRMLLFGGDWLLVMECDRLPGSVLGLLASWLRRLPEPGEALYCMDGILDGIVDGVRAIPTGEVDAPVLHVLRDAADFPRLLDTGIAYHDSCILQAETGKVCGFPMLSTVVCGGLSGGRLASAGAELWGVWEDITLGAVYCIRCESAIPTQVLAAIEAADLYGPSGRKE